MTRRWLVAGCRGQLGCALERLLSECEGAEVVAAVDLPEVDLADEAAVAALFDGLGASPPDVVINAAAFTHVDRCEREPEVAQRSNADAPDRLARACGERGSLLVHVSTDYVFPGDSQTPYAEHDAPAPRSAYGRTKLEGERRVQAVSSDFLIVRTSWVFGRGRNFIAAILGQAEQRRSGATDGPLRVVADQHGRPTYAADLAAAILALVEAGAGGLYHIANAGVATWWDLARATLDEAGFKDLSVERIRTDELDLDAPRPAWSVLDTSKAEGLGVILRPWREAVAAYLNSEESPRTPQAAEPMT